jgi:hypothetical protein
LFTKCTLFFLVVGVVGSCTSAIGEVRDPYAEYIAGISLLTAVKQNQTESKRLRQFEALGQLTGLHPQEVQAFLMSLKDDPKKGKQLYERMNRLNQNKAADTTTH